MDAFGGRPVWLASYSLKNGKGKIVPTADFDHKQRVKALETLRKALRGVGDETGERFFRMCVTHCFHRVLSLAEEAGLSEAWKRAEPVDIAGGPVEVFWQHGVPESARLSTSPCENPGHLHLGQTDLWLPIDCEMCPPCVARRDARYVCPVATAAG